MASYVAWHEQTAKAADPYDGTDRPVYVRGKHSCQPRRFLDHRSEGHAGFIHLGDFIIIRTASEGIDFAAAGQRSGT